jgi:hypothetical protein
MSVCFPRSAGPVADQLAAYLCVSRHSTLVKRRSLLDRKIGLFIMGMIPSRKHCYFIKYLLPDNPKLEPQKY